MGSTRSRRLLIGLGLILCLWPQSGFAQRGGPAKIGPLPFEAALAAERRDRVLLNFNDPISALSNARVRGLPMIEGRLGDRVVTVDGLLLYFPVGFLATAAYEFDRLRLRAGRVRAAGPADLEPNPRYAWVERFDAEFGPVCARSNDRASDTITEMRLRGRVMAVVVNGPGRFDRTGNDKSRSFAVLAGIEERYVAADDLAKRLLAQCRSGVVGEIPSGGGAVRILTASETSF